MSSGAQWDQVPLRSLSARLKAAGFEKEAALAQKGALSQASVAAFNRVLQGGHSEKKGKNISRSQRRRAKQSTADSRPSTTGSGSRHARGQSQLSVLWSCDSCGADHFKDLQTCRLCKAPRAPPAAPAVATSQPWPVAWPRRGQPAASQELDADAADDADMERSAEEVAKRRKQLTDLRASMLEAGYPTDSVDAELSELPEPPKPTALPKNVFYKAEKAVHRAEQELKDISDKLESIAVRHSQLQRDLEAAQRARSTAQERLDVARRERREAIVRLNAVDAELAAAPAREAQSQHDAPATLGAMVQFAQQMQDCLRAGSWSSMIDDGEQLYQEYLDSGIPEGGFVDYEEWLTQQVAAKIEAEVSSKCKAMQQAGSNQEHSAAGSAASRGPRGPRFTREGVPVRAANTALPDPVTSSTATNNALATRAEGRAGRLAELRATTATGVEN